MVIEAVIFDMDGVIIDSEPLYFELQQNILKRYGYKMTRAERDLLVGGTLEYIWGQLKKMFDLDINVDEIIKEINKGYEDYLNSSKDIEPIEGVKELIIKLHEKGVKLAVASSSTIEHIKLVVKKFSLERYFTSLVSGHFVENSKPAPDIFLYAAKELEVDSRNCLVIEDSKNGIIGANSAGMKTIGYKSKNSGNQDLTMADLVISTFNDTIFDLIQNI